MSLIMVGMSHKKTPLDIRQKFYLHDPTILDALHWFTLHHPQSNIIILSTCNRIELYAYKINQEYLYSWWANACGADLSILKTHSYSYENLELIRHLYEVACGLQSMVIGEHQILGQLKHAYSLAQSVKCLKNPFNRLFEHCFFTAKSIRASFMQELIVPSLEQRVITIIQRRQPKNILLIGAGQTMHLVLKKLEHLNHPSITLCNRTDVKAATLADIYQCRYRSYDQLKSAIAESDCIVIATSSQTPLLTSEDFRDALSRTIIDLSVPANTCHSLLERKEIELIRIDALQHHENEDMIKHSIILKKAHQALTQAIERFNHWLATHSKREEVKIYRNTMQLEQKKLELAALKKLSEGEDPALVLKEFSYKLTQKLLHQPSLALKECELPAHE